MIVLSWPAIATEIFIYHANLLNTIIIIGQYVCVYLVAMGLWLTHTQKKNPYNRGCVRARQDSELALSDKSTAGNSAWMDESSGTVPSVTADFMRKTFYPEDEHVADPEAASLTDRSCRCCLDSVGRVLCDQLWSHLPIY